MSAYLAVLRVPDFRRLWMGLVLNLLGDGASFVALAWLASDQAGAKGLTALGVCYTLPVIVGGLLVGPLLDRCSRRAALIADSIVRGFVLVSIPLLHAMGALPSWLIYVVAAVYGFLKIVPFAVVPTVTPQLVPAERLQAASGLEAVALGAAAMAGPAIGAVLIGAVGSHQVLLLDAATYWLFALLIARIRTPLGRPERVQGTDDRGGWAPVLRLVVRDRFLLAIVLSFAAFNISAGVLVVALPWLARFQFAADPYILGLLLAASAGAELVGSLISGGLRTSDRQMLRIGVLQFFSGAAFLLLLSDHLSLIAAGLVVSGVLSGPMTVLSGVVRMTRIPDALRGRTMTLTRTVMAGGLPLGSALAGAMLAAGHYTLLVLAMAVIAAGPGVFTVAAFRTASFREGLERGVNAPPVAAAERAGA